MKHNTITSSHVDLERNAQADTENSNEEATNQNIDRSSQNKISEEQKRPNKGKKNGSLSALLQQQENMNRRIDLSLSGLAQQQRMESFINGSLSVVAQQQSIASVTGNGLLSAIAQQQEKMNRLADLGASGVTRRMENGLLSAIAQQQEKMNRLADLGANEVARRMENGLLSAVAQQQQRMDKLLALSGNGLSEIVNNIDRWTSLKGNWSFGLTVEEENKVRDTLATLPEAYKLKIDENEKSCLIESTETKVSIPLEDVPSTLGVIDVVSNITSEEIFSFYNHLVKYPMLGLEHEIGNRILEQIEHSKRFTAKDLTLHRARERKRELPFSDVEMFEAPFGIAGHGRFNVWGQGELYTCDNKETAIEELKVSSSSCVDVVTWRLQTPLDVLDLVEADSPLVRFCSYTKQTGTNLEYLVPNFLSQCAKFVGIHGIRFRSNINNQFINYVFFDFEHSFFKTINLERNYITLD